MTVWADGRTPKRVCSAKRTNGDPCKRAPIEGSNVCATHGGRAPQVKRKAAQRLEEAADRMARELLRMAEDADLAPAVKLAAIRDALDRAGLSPKSLSEITVKAAPFELVLEGIVAGPRMTDTPPPSNSDYGEDNEDDNIIDAEIVEDEESSSDGSHSCGGCGRQFPDELPPGMTAYPELCRDCRDTARHERADYREHKRDDPARPETSLSAGTGLLTQEEARDQIRAERRAHLGKVRQRGA